MTTETEILTVDMKWKQSARLIAMALQDPKISPEGRSIALDELMRMADVADFAVELQAELRKSSSGV